MKIFLSILLFFISILSSAQNTKADDILGVWVCEDYKIEFFKTGDKYAAKILWAKDMDESDGEVSKKDTKNPDQKLRSRTVQGITHISGLVFKQGEYVDGKLYSFQDGNTYSIKGMLKGKDQLETRGYRGVPMIGKTFKWKRTQ